MNPYLLSLFTFIFFTRYFADPKFETQVLDTNVAIGYGLAIGDVDGDRKPDILLADKKQFVWYRNGDWKRFVMVDNLTESDNVCIAARDIDGDGMVEVAVGAQWNPSETSDTAKSGSVHYLIRPEDPTRSWTPVKLHHEATIHRMRWVRAGDKKFQLIVVPLHGLGNKNGNGQAVKVFAYEISKDQKKKRSPLLIDQSMHMTHNFDLMDDGKTETIYLGGKEGIKIISLSAKAKDGKNYFVQGKSFGEVRVGRQGHQKFIAGIEPMHGNQLTVYTRPDTLSRKVLTSDLNQGHALATADLLGLGSDQIIVGWREPNSEKKVGIKIFVKQGEDWENYWVDDNGMACEDLQIADLDGDGKKDIIAAGRASHNLKIYWNKNK